MMGYAVESRNHDELRAFITQRYADPNKMLPAILVWGQGIVCKEV
jgi:hypothetical protein